MGSYCMGKSRSSFKAWCKLAYMLSNCTLE
uniref:Uncharacterized protein n=1 Tax=Rhizophora mucronata TaxID=61149 RepID=A0A2P2NKC0_RHIMU